MNWDYLLKGIDVISFGGEGNPLITDITFDSRAVKDGSLFIAVAGFNRNGDDYIELAIKNGAVAIISQNSQEKLKTPWAKVDNSRIAMAKLGERLWEIDFNKMKTVGITGTNGKTTTATLFRNLFSSIYSKESSVMFGTINYEIGNRVVEATRTTPESVDLMRYLSESEIEPTSLVMEVASHALELSRIEGFKFDIAIWTNLTQDHLDFHISMEKYYEAKRKLFLNHLKVSGCAIINIDDSWGEKLSKELADKDIITYGYNENANFRINSDNCSWNSTEINVTYKNNNYRFVSTLAGKFNVYNMSGVIAGAFALGFNETQIQNGLDQTSGVAGRMQKSRLNLPFSVIVDYAHTPDALKNVLSTVKKLTEGKVIAVFGSGGDRDKTKRAPMAKAVVENSDIAIVTTDNPRTEKPARIIKDVMMGIPMDKPSFVIEDRRNAIKKALEIATSGDCVVIAGKGHETYQEVNGVKYHFDDMEVVTELAKELF